MSLSATATFRHSAPLATSTSKTDMNENTENSPFGDLIYSYTRAQAIADGFQIEVTKTAQESGIRFPVFLTRMVYEAYVVVLPGVAGQDEAGRLWDIIPST